MEKLLIKKLKSNIREFGYNHSSGGEGVSGMIPSNFIDLTNMEFGDWKVLNKANSKKYINGVVVTYWTCQCKCGTIKNIAGETLRNEDSKSCGCTRNEKISLLNSGSKKLCSYLLDEKFVTGSTQNGYSFIIDINDYDKIKDFSWMYVPSNDKISCHINGKYIYLHQLIMDTINIKEEVIYLSDNHLDLRKSNLKIRDRINVKTISTVNGQETIAGVTFDRYKNKWIARINFNKKQIHIGTYQNKEDAIQARLLKEKELYQLNEAV